MQNPVQVLIFEDLQCFDCAYFARKLDQQLVPKYSAGVRFEHRDFPLPKHSWSRKAAIAARHFDEVQAEIGSAYRKHLLADMKTIAAEQFEDDLRKFSSAHSVDPNQAIAALTDVRLAAAVERDYQEGLRHGVTRTPTVFVNDTRFIEKFRFEDVAQAIDQALAQ